MGNPKLMSNVMGTIQCPVPPLPVQEEIVRILDKFTALEAELETELEAELEARRKQYEFYRDQLLTFGDEVEWRPLGEIVSSIASGKNKTRKDTGIYCVYGSTGVIAQTDVYMYKGPCILIARVGANAGFVYLVNGLYDVSDNALMIRIPSETNIRFIYYLLTAINLNQFAKGGGQPLITASFLRNIKVPLPPLAEQERIVAILDKFDALVNDISSGLPAELEMRRKQYEYYRNRLLTFKPLAKEA